MPVVGEVELAADVDGAAGPVEVDEGEVSECRVIQARVGIDVNR